jgi:hypothetical protein
MPIQVTEENGVKVPGVEVNGKPGKASSTEAKSNGPHCGVVVSVRGTVVENSGGPLRALVDVAFGGGQSTHGSAA